jgi:hypothetical protein
MLLDTMPTLRFNRPQSTQTTPENTFGVSLYSVQEQNNAIIQHH